MSVEFNPDGQANVRWRDEYNNERPHSSLGGLAPSEFVASSNENAMVLSLRLTLGKVRIPKAGQ